MAAARQSPSLEDESEAAKALWEITNSPGLAKKGSSCLTPRGPAGRDYLMGFPTPQGLGHGSPSVNYNRFFSPSQFSWSPLPGQSPALQSLSSHSYDCQSSQHPPSMPSFFSSMSQSSSITNLSEKDTLNRHVQEATTSKVLHRDATGVTIGERETKKKAYSKKLDFAGTCDEKASCVWLSLDSETQRVARGGPGAAPPASPAAALQGSIMRESHFFVSRSPFKQQAEDYEGFLASSAGRGAESINENDFACKNGRTASSKNRGTPIQSNLDKSKTNGDKCEIELGGHCKGCAEQEDGAISVSGQKQENKDDEEQRLHAAEVLLNEATGIKLWGARQNLPPPPPVKTIPMNKHGGSNWGGIQVRVKKKAPQHSLSADPSLLEAIAAMIPSREASSSPPQTNFGMPPPQSPRTTTASRGGFAPGSPVLEAMAMVTLSQSPSVFSSDRKKGNASRPCLSAPRVLMPSTQEPFSGIQNFSAGAPASEPVRVLDAGMQYQTPTTGSKNSYCERRSEGTPSSGSCCCKKSRCLKLYCECFRGGFTCQPSCKCRNCANVAECEAERAEAVDKIMEKKRRKSAGSAGRMQGGSSLDGEMNSVAGSPSSLRGLDLDSGVKIGSRPYVVRASEQEREFYESAFSSTSLATELDAHMARRPRPSIGTGITSRGTSNVIFTVKSPDTTFTPVQRRSKRKNVGDGTPDIPVPGKPARPTPKGRGTGRKDEFLLSVFGPRSRVNKQNSLEVLSYLDRDDMADASLVSSLWNRLALETLDE